MRDAELRRDPPRVMDVLPRATRLGATARLAVVVELQRDPDDIIASQLGETCDDRGIDPARHRTHEPGRARFAGEVDCGPNAAEKIVI